VRRARRAVGSLRGPTPKANAESNRQCAKCEAAAASSSPPRSGFVQQVHTAHEEISIIYDTTGSSGVAPNKLHVHYNGRDSRIAERKDLALDEVRPILLEWSQQR
jgi:hypothetical protein